MNALLVIFLISFPIYALIYCPHFILWFVGLAAAYHLIFHVLLFRDYSNSVKTRGRNASWVKSLDPQIFGKVKLDTAKFKAFLAEYSAKNNTKITLTVLFIKLVGQVLSKYPEINGFIKFGRYIPKDSVDVNCTVQVGNGEGLATYVVQNAEKKTLVQIATELREEAAKLRKGKNQGYNDKMNLVNAIPTFILGFVISILGYLAGIGIGIPFLGMTAFEFGSVTVTSVGSIGLSNAYASIDEMLFNPLIVTLGAPNKKVELTEKGPVEKEYIAVNLTFDSRFSEPHILKQAIEDLKRYANKPSLLEN